MIVIGQPTSITYLTTYGGLAVIELPVRVVVARTTEQRAQDLIDAALSTGDDSSVIDALLALEGPWKTLTANTVGEPIDVTVGQSEAVEAVFQLTIHARRDQ